MPNSTLPPDNYLGDPERTTGEFQDQINNLQNWINTLQDELQALSSTTVREGAVRSVGNTGTQLRQADSFGSAADVAADQNLRTSDSVDFNAVTESGNEVAHKPGAGSNQTSLGFDTWRTPNANRPTLVTASTSGTTDGTNSHLSKLVIDNSGGTSADAKYDITYAEGDLPADTQLLGSATAIVPPGGSYQVELTFTGQNNNVRAIFEFTL